MADARRGKQKRTKQKDADSEKPSKEQYAVAKFLRFGAPNKEGKFLGNSVQYFVGSKVVDSLLESKWSSKKAKTNALFTNRGTCVTFCQCLLEKGFFHRVAKPEKREKKKKVKEGAAEKGSLKEEKKQEKKTKKEEAGDGKKEKETDVKEKKEKDSKVTDENVDAQKEDSGQEDKKRKKKKLKLEMHDTQIFFDSSDLYVWIYDPVPLKTFVIGLFLVLGAIAVCLFPLWPPEVKLGVYYLSLAGAGFIGVILSLCIVRMILFVIVWLLTLGKVSFWLLPNLTEDVGFFESFRPVYKYDFKDAQKNDEKDAKEDADKKAEDTLVKGESNEEKTEHLAVDDGKLDGGSDEDEDDEDKGKLEDEDEDEEEEDDGENDEDAVPDPENGHSGSSNDNGYEIIDAEEVDEISQADEEESEEETETRHRKRHKCKDKEKAAEGKKTK